MDKIDPKAIERAMSVARGIAEGVDPGFGRVRLPRPGAGVPLVHEGGVGEGFAAGGQVDDEPPIRPLTPGGLYSGAADAAMALKQAKGPPGQMLSALKSRQPRGLNEETKWSGAPEALAGQPSVTREDMARAFNRGIPPLETKTYRSRRPGGAMDEDDDPTPPEGDTKFSAYTLPGGENYRETLLKLPQRVTKIPYADVNSKALELAHRDTSISPEDLERYKADPSLVPWERPELGKIAKTRMGLPSDASLWGYPRDPHYRLEREGDNFYHRPHWPDANVVAHLRLSDRTGPVGEKMLHLEELQSDWGQQGRERGFATPENREALNDNYQRAYRAAKDFDKEVTARGEEKLRASGLDPAGGSGPIYPYQHAELLGPEVAAKHGQLWEAYDEANRKKNDIGVPPGPYVGKTEHWTDLGLKHALTEAARGGHDKLIWTPGEEQAKRYSLQSHLDAIHYSKTREGNKYAAVLGLKGGGIRPLEEDMSEAELVDMFGKEIAQKMIAGEGSEEGAARYGSQRTLSGLDLKVGGKGMREYYDKILPQRLLALAQEHDPEAKLEEHGQLIPAATSGDLDGPKPARRMTFPALRITPRMRASIQNRGFRAYRVGGYVPPAGAARGVHPASLIPGTHISTRDHGEPIFHGK